MDTIAPSVSEAEFATLVRRAGLTLSEPQRGVLYAVWGNLEAMLERVRIPGRASDTQRPRGAEPAHVFVPGQGWP